MNYLQSTELEQRLWSWPRRLVLGRNLLVGRLKDVIPTIVDAAKHGARWRIAHVNVHMVMEAIDNPDFASQLDTFDMQLPDGRPLIWWLRRLKSAGHAGQMRGLDCMNAICQLAAAEGVNIGIYGGGDSEHTSSIQSHLQQIYPQINIVYCKTPLYGDEELKQRQVVREEVVTSGVQILFVALGCPKQELWIAQQELPCIQIGVGAAIDFLTGRKREAPKLLQKLGLEWLWRLCAEPQRLWRRYLKHNPRFLWLLFKNRI